ncbi:MAG: sulfotransferase family protein [Candidatus Binataceae bacterium]
MAGNGVRRPQRGRLPDFLGVGPPRTATSWLDAVLRGHVGLPHDIKEVDFFVKNYAHGIEWYKGYFADCEADLPVGEICPSYFGSAAARERIAEHIPNCRIICTFRDPVELLYSFYKLALRNVWTRGDFESYIPDNWHRHAAKLKAWQDTFGRENVLVRIYDDLEADPQAYLDPICDFIGINPIAIAASAIATERVNSFRRLPKSLYLARKARKVRDWLKAREAYGTMGLLARAGVWRFCFERGEEFPPLDFAVAARVRKRFLPEVEALENLIGRDLSAWKAPRSSVGADTRASATAPTAPETA